MVLCLAAGRRLALLLACLGVVWLAAPGPQGAAAQSGNLQVPIVYITKLEQERVPLALVDPIITDKGLVGARAALKDNATTGRFLKHDYHLIEAVVPEGGDLIAAFKEQLDAGQRFFVADVHDDQLLAMAKLPEAADALIFNVRAMDDSLRTSECYGNLFHIIPSRAMKADALTQYLVWKKWRRWFLVQGKGPGDLAFADAIRRSAKKFGAKIVEERSYEGEASSARTDSGHAQIQMQMPVFTQDAPDYDVLVVSDESDIFGEYLPYRTWDPRPVVGTQGLVPTSWHRVNEQWGATQVQRRFEKFAHRDMTERDYTAWVAVRTIGEAVTRTNSADAATLKAYLLGDEFNVAAFKGEGLTFRKWNHQLRQPVLLASARSLVSVSPQVGFLHQRSQLDTLGYDEPESQCRLD